MKLLIPESYAYSLNCIHRNTCRTTALKLSKKLLRLQRAKELSAIGNDIVNILSELDKGLSVNSIGFALLFASFRGLYLGFSVQLLGSVRLRS